MSVYYIMLLLVLFKCIPHESFLVTSHCKEIHSLLILTISISTDGQFPLLIVCACIIMYIVRNGEFSIVMYYPRLIVKILIKNVQDLKMF